MMKKLWSKRQKGFAMLFTVLIVSLILTIGLGISNIVFKQTILSNLAKDSQVAFYQGDAAVECGLYYDQNQNSFPTGSTASTVPASIKCGLDTLNISATQSAVNYFVYTPSTVGAGTPCNTLIIDKTTAGKTTIQGIGFSTCQASTRQVERELDVSY